MLPPPLLPASAYLQSGASSLGSKTGSTSRSSAYQFQRFQGEGQDDDSQFESVNLLSLEAAEALCSRMRGGIPVEVCVLHSHAMSGSFSPPCCLKVVRKTKQLMLMFFPAVAVVVFVAAVLLRLQTIHLVLPATLKSIPIL